MRDFDNHYNADRLQDVTEVVRAAQKRAYEAGLRDGDADGYLRGFEQGLKEGLTKATDNAIKQLEKTIQELVIDPDPLAVTADPPSIEPPIDRLDQMLNQPIKELGLSPRPLKALQKGKILTVGQLINEPRAQLFAVLNRNQQSLLQIIAKLETRGLILTD